MTALFLLIPKANPDAALSPLNSCLFFQDRAKVWHKEPNRESQSSRIPSFLSFCKIAFGLSEQNINKALSNVKDFLE
jgi:hypothetical protein